MQVACPRCSKVLEFSGERPLFCAYCASPLSDSKLDETDAFQYQPVSPRARKGKVGDSGSVEETAGFVGHGSGSGSGSSSDRGPDSGLPDPTQAATGAYERSRGTPREPDPEQVAGYRITRLLGRGGMGSVYEAIDTNIGRRVALKLIAADHVASGEAVERFRQEGRLASTISHPRCVFVLAADEERGRPYIVMELMPGETLQTLVESRGPLPLGEAIAKILDIIEGLQEAHLQGVIHRDVKPSNCFLEANGRVKVGDFGLSKSLDSDSNITRTGSFIGTPLYASPEQIKRDEIDERTDVYSVTATLYYLLTGKPPFEAGDAAATLAKIVSEPPTPLRKHQPDLPAAIEAIILRGLDRDRDRRYQNLDRLRAALLPFVSVRLRLPDLAVRSSAFLVDAILILLANFTFILAVFSIQQRGFQNLGRVVSSFSPWIFAAKPGLVLLYFALFEGLLGYSIGKRLTGLRVARATGEGGPPGIVAGFSRILIFYVLTNLAADLFTASLLKMSPARNWVGFEVFWYVVSGAGVLVIASTMRASNGYQGLHELLTRTRVTRVPRSFRRRAPQTRRLPVLSSSTQASGSVGVLKSVGPFTVRGAVRWDGNRRVLLGEDTTLRRPVWLVIRPKGSPPPSQNRRDLARQSRPRWLNGGVQTEGRWDAYSAQLGCSLADLSGPDGLNWADARPLLHDLAEELLRACEDGTLPEALGVDQVWVQPDGSVQLADPLEVTRAKTGTDEERSLELLRQTAAIALEGGRHRSHRPLTSIDAAVPEHAARMLDRLIGSPRDGDTSYANLADLVADLEADREKPTEVDLARRFAHLAPSSIGHAAAVIGLLVLTFPRRSLHPITPTILFLFPILMAAWCAITRGGLLLGLAGLALVRRDSRPAERWRCGWRAMVVWMPVITLLAGSWWVRTREARRAAAGQLTISQSPHLAEVFWGLAVLLLVAYLAFAMISPARAWHDRLAGTQLVPK